MRLFLARHGETDDNISPVRFQGQRDTPLNERGRAQADALANQCTGLGIESIYSSHLKRASDTAAAVAKRLNLQVEIDDRIAEGWRGRWEGRLVEEVKNSEPSEYAEWMQAGEGFRFPEGESLVEHRERALAAVREIVVRGKRPLIVTHGGTIRLLILESTGSDISEFHQIKVPNAKLITLEGDRLERVLRSRHPIV